VGGVALLPLHWSWRQRGCKVRGGPRKTARTSLLNQEFYQTPELESFEKSKKQKGGGLEDQNETAGVETGVNGLFLREFFSNLTQPASDGRTGAGLDYWGPKTPQLGEGR